MKKLFLITNLIFIAIVAFGGGIVTNSNQSAYWVRTLVRDAAISPDAVYFNPAGLTKLKDGFHFSLSSQTIFQNKDVTNDYSLFNPSPKKYFGDVKAPVFPSIYATWKMNKIALSFGFNPIGGGGGATFEDGLPAFEFGVSDMKGVFSDILGTQSDYRRDVYFKGTSVFFGYQLGLTYQLTDMVSVYAGARYVSAKNTYEGYLRNVEVLMGENWVEVSDAFSNVAIQAALGAGAASGISTSMGAMITAGLPGTFTLEQAETAGAITSAQRAQIEGGLTQMGIPTNLQLSQIQAYTNAAALEYTAAQQAATENSAITALTFNQEADVVQKGHGITPIIGINIAVSEKLNIGFKYEFMTKIELENETKGDFIIGFDTTTVVPTPVTMFPNGAKVRNDMPAMMSLGVDYKITPKFSATAGFHYYWDKKANYGKTLHNEEIDNDEIIDRNYMEFGLGLEYGITENFLASLGYLYAQTGVSNDYQNDLSFSLSSNTFGGGFGYKINDKIMINAGVLYSKYDEGKKSYFVERQTIDGTENIEVTDTYYKDNLIFSLGLDLSF